MDGGEMMQAMAEVIDAHDWAALAALLHDRFVCRYVHTGESFDREGWLRLNADYPGFERFLLRDVVAQGERAAGRAHVTSRTDDTVHQFGVASFLRVADGLAVDLVEVWTDVLDAPPDRSTATS